MLSLDISTYTLQKAGTDMIHYEDAYAFDVAMGRAAVADGASDAFESGPWARLLVASYVHSPPENEAEAFSRWIRGRARMWNCSLEWDKLPWYAQQKAHEVGGLATLLGFSLGYTAQAEGEPPKARWQALAMGDSCLLQIHNASVVTRFPIEDTQSFGNMPILLATRAETIEAVLDRHEPALCSGTCEAGDVFLLATDAIAHWLYGLVDLERLGMELQDWDTTLHRLEDNFEALIADLRTRSIMRNDDVTLLVARVVEDPEGGNGHE